MTVGLGAAVLGGAGFAQADSDAGAGHSTGPKTTHASSARHSDRAASGAATSVASAKAQAAAEGPRKVRSTLAGARPAIGGGTTSDQGVDTAAAATDGDGEASATPAITSSAPSPMASSSGSRQVGPVTPRPTAEVSTAAAETNPFAGLLRGVASLFGLNRSTAPTDPIGALVWNIWQQIASAFGAAPKAGTPTVSTPVVTTGLVTGQLGMTDPAGGSLTYTVTTDPAKGEVTVDTNGTYSYTPTLAARLAAAAGTGPTADTFTVTANNGIASVLETVTVPISPDIPVAGTPTVGTPHIVTGVLSGGVNFTDPAGQPLTYSVSTGPMKGTITQFNSATGEFTYTPTVAAQLAAEAAGAVGADTFVISASNGAASTPVTIHVVVDPGTPQVGTPSMNTSDPSGTVTGTAVFTDPAGGQLTYSVTGNPAHGTITAFDTATGAYTYVPDPDTEDVSDAFTVTASNGVHTAGQTVSVPINITDPLVGSWNVNSVTQGLLDGSSEITVPLPEGQQIQISFSKDGGNYVGVFIATADGQTTTADFATFTKTAPGTYSATMPADQLQAYEQNIRDMNASYFTIDDLVLSVTYTVTVAEDGKSMKATQIIIEKFTMTPVGSTTGYPVDYSTKQTLNTMKVPAGVAV